MLDDATPTDTFAASGFDITRGHREGHGRRHAQQSAADHRQPEQDHPEPAGAAPESAEDPGESGQDPAQGQMTDFIARLNGPWHKTGMRVFMGIVLAHWAEH